MSARAGLISALAVAVIIATSAPVLAQDPQDPVDRLLGQPISAVELQVEGRPDTSAPLLALVDIKPGETFTIEAYRRVADRFNQVPRFQTVTVLAAERPTGLVIIFNLEPRHPVDRLEFPGEETGLPESDLQRLVRDRFSGLPAFTRLGEVEDVVRLILEEEGFRSASVTADLVRFHDPDRSTLNIQIRAGQRTTIRSIKVNGQSWSLEMPPLGPALNDEQIAGVLTYIRREWEHTESAVTPQEVAKIRAATKSRTKPWTSEDLQKPFDLKTAKAK